MSVADMLLRQRDELQRQPTEALQDRERARDCAVALEQENALLTAQRDALVAVVRDEWPRDMSLAEIAISISPWGGGVTEEQMTALRAYEKGDDGE